MKVPGRRVDARDMEFTTQHYILMGVAAVLLLGASRFLGIDWNQHAGDGDTDYDDD